MKEQSDTPSWWRCDTHGPGTRTAWGCPECVRELRTSLATATRDLDEARAALRAIKLEAVSLADAQVIALEALAATKEKP